MKIHSTVITSIIRQSSYHSSMIARLLNRIHVYFFSKYYLKWHSYNETDRNCWIDAYIYTIYTSIYQKLCFQIPSNKEDTINMKKFIYFLCYRQQMSRQFTVYSPSLPPFTESSNSRHMCVSVLRMPTLKSLGSNNLPYYNIIIKQ